MANQMKCKICGNEIWSTATSCPYCDDDPSNTNTEIKYCGSCQSVLSSSAKYCPNCGEERPTSSSSAIPGFMFTILAIAIVKEIYDLITNPEQLEHLLDMARKFLGILIQAIQE